MSYIPPVYNIYIYTQSQLQICKQKCENTERELRDISGRIQQLTTEVQQKDVSYNKLYHVNSMSLS